MSEYIEIGNDKAIKLEEWKENYSISQHRKYEGKWYWKAVRNVQGKDQVAEKSSPVKIELGSKDTAIPALLAILRELGWTGEDNGDDKPPF